MPEAILVVDDHPLYRDALLQVLQAHFGGFALLTAGMAAQGLQLAESTPGLRLLLLDLALPSGLSGIEAVAAFRRACPQAALVVVTASDDRRHAAAAFAAGAKAFVSKATPSERLVDVLQRVLHGGLVEPEWITADGGLADRDLAMPGLTPRQREILLLLCEGHSNKEIGLRCGLAEITVKMHVSGLFRFFGVSNRTQAVLAARHAGFYVPGASASS